MAIVLLSCNQENDYPEIYSEEAYEHTRMSSADNPVYVQLLVMSFRKSGSVLVENYMTPADAEVRCLSGYNEGTYSLKGVEFNISLTSSFGPDSSIDLSSACIANNQLVSYPYFYKMWEH